jgi:uncharacterized protein YoxC
MLAQVVTDASTANWVIAVTLIILGALLTRILNRLESKLEDHDTRISEAETAIEIIKHKGSWQK